MTTNPDYLMPSDFVWGVATSAYQRVLKDSGAAYADIIRTQRGRSSESPVAYPAS